MATAARRSGACEFVAARWVASVVEADLLLKLDDGPTVERGTHAEMVGKAGAHEGLLERSRLLAQVAWPALPTRLPRSPPAS